MIKLVEIEFDLKEVVYIKTDPYQNPGIIATILVRPNDVLYGVSFSTFDRFYSDFELSKEKNVTGGIQKMTNEKKSDNNKEEEKS